MMITIEHYGNEYPPMVSWSIRDAIVGETRDYMVAYWAGLLEPNFHVPATEADNCAALNYWHLKKCIFNPPCNVCIDDYCDGLEFDFPEAFK